ncbi:palmitoyl-monogalactosyldiacylglycerol delta-7 desaturase, chloroplastic-like [Helianthus annuus]|uniref:palmitoyl-monogalactosyldiacylglycerol delta-7 desaturase, chloroplastic-like n=1 Tax=Helianthus annuus TaxID=4232 RepID=UPI0016533C8A|nr:palmitoyl-monogalactosyldiacylglycerol delta-7 desaturase, chloroplastic-like [Helianthus annuus]
MTISIEGEEEPVHKTIFMSDVVVTRKRNLFRNRKWNIVDVITLIWVLFVHFLRLFAPFTFTWGAFWAAFLFHVLCGMFCITLSYHRNLAHRSLKLPKWLEYTFAYFGVQAAQGVRITFTYHVTFLVNSACHIWGNQVWNTGDLSKNNFWWEIDFTWWCILFLEAIGLATNVKLPTKAHKVKRSFTSSNKLK